MGATIEFVFKAARKVDGLTPAVRIWLDENRDLTLQDEEELTVTKVAGALEWRATKWLSTFDTERMAYRVTFLIGAGVSWLLTVASDSPSAHPISQKADITLYPSDSVTGRLTR
jgi:hypothetical protein